MLAELLAWALAPRGRFEAHTSDQSQTGAELPKLVSAKATPVSAADTASALASMIETSRQRVIADGVYPVPATTYSALLGFFPSGLLQKVRCAGVHHNPLTLPVHTVVYGDAIALALGEVVLFKTDALAQVDLKLWAHELTHVMQYQRWGVEGFADHYVRDSAGVEQEAIDNADRFGNWLSRRIR